MEVEVEVVDRPKLVPCLLANGTSIFLDTSGQEKESKAQKLNVESSD